VEKSQSHVHLIVFAYGALDVFESVLLKRGVRPGAPPSIPDSHVHHYHVERDAEERAVLQELDWRVKPLRESDAQFGRLSRSAAYR